MAPKPTRPTRSKRRRRLIIVAAAVVLVIVAANMIFGRMHRGSISPRAALIPSVTTSTVAPQPTSTSTAETEPVPPTVVSGPTTVPTQSVVPSTEATQDTPQLVAVTAAATALTELCRVQIQPAAQITQTVNTYVVPAQRKSITTAYIANGSRLLLQWGYPAAPDGVNQAAYNLEVQQASYYLEVHMYRVNSWLPNSQLNVSFFTISHWDTNDGGDYNVPSITVVQMNWVNGNWLFVSSTSPPASEMPTPLPNLTVQQTLDQFQPFLKGYIQYVTGNH